MVEVTVEVVSTVLFNSTGTVSEAVFSIATFSIGVLHQLGGPRESGRLRAAHESTEGGGSGPVPRASVGEVACLP